MATASVATVDFEAIKAKHQATWSSGNYAVVGVTLQIVGEELCEALDVRAGQKVLDVAAGNGNATLAAARRFCDVVSTDFVAALLESGRARASAEGLQVEFRTADAEQLPFDDCSFDAVLSTFGVMFAPNHARSSAEMLRVVRRGGKIGVANWTPEGFVGQLFKTISKYVPPPAGTTPAPMWGTHAHLVALFGTSAAEVEARPRHYVFRYRSPQHFLDVFRTYYGPALKAFSALDALKQQALADDILALINRLNRADDGTMLVASEYLQAVITKR